MCVDPQSSERHRTRLERDNRAHSPTPIKKKVTRAERADNRQKVHTPSVLANIPVDSLQVLGRRERVLAFFHLPGYDPDKHFEGRMNNRITEYHAERAAEDLAALAVKTAA